MSKSNWGSGETKYFFELSPDKVLDAVESIGVRATGRLFQLNSMENRVYEVEIETSESTSKSKWDSRKIIKFYRPGRWSLEQIKDEHTYLNDLRNEEIPVANPEKFEDGSTVKKLRDLDIYCSVFPRIGGRSPDELNFESYETIGRILARMHNVGEKQPAKSRLTLDSTSFGSENLKFIIDNGLLPTELRHEYVKTFEKILELSEPHLKKLAYQRIHGDAHLGNLLSVDESFFFVDFDDMLMGPTVQDLWLIIPGIDAESRQFREALLEGYTSLRNFNRSDLKLTETLRAMRLVHFSAWIGKRFDDPYFKKTFSDYGSWGYWNSQLADLTDQLKLVKDSLQGSPGEIG